MSKQDAAEKQVVGKALAAFNAGRAHVEWGDRRDIEMVASDGRWGPVEIPDGAVMQPGREHAVDTGRRCYEVTIRWTE